MPYEQPAQAEKFSPRDHPEWLGKLFLIYPTSADMVVFNNDDGTPKPPSEVITADVAIVDLIDPTTGQATVLLGARIGGKALVPQIKPYTLKPNTAAAGRLRQMPGQGAKSGAYVLDNFDVTRDAPTLNQFDATDWRGKYSPPVPPQTAQPVYQPPLTGASTAAATAPPSYPQQAAAPVAPAGGAPWFALGNGPEVFARLMAGGVANAAQLDETTARMIAAQLPG